MLLLRTKNPGCKFKGPSFDFAAGLHVKIFHTSLRTEAKRNKNNTLKYKDECKIDTLLLKIIAINGFRLIFSQHYELQKINNITIFRARTSINRICTNVLTLTIFGHKKLIGDESH